MQAISADNDPQIKQYKNIYINKKNMAHWQHKYIQRKIRRAQANQKRKE